MAKTYVEKYVEHRFDGGRVIENVRHKRNNQCEAGFDNTTFESSSDFQKVMDKHNMEYRRVERSNGDYYYTWSNSRVMLVTEWNPTSNRRSDGSKLRKRRGDPNKMGLQGECQAVDSLADDLKMAARSVKAFHPNERAYI